MSDITAGIKAGRYHQGTLRWVLQSGLRSGLPQ